MDQATIIASWEQRAREANVPIRDVCHKAGMAPSTFSRWKRTPNPIGITLKTAEKFEAALAEFEAEEKAA